MSTTTDPVLVVAIDFGTTYSGYAIQFKHEYDENDPTKIRAPQVWNGGKQNLLSYKTPTCLLLNSNQEFDSFGYEAEEKYAQLCISETNRSYYFYRRFKMRLQDTTKIKMDSKLEDETGKSMPALKVFSLAIKCLKDHMMESTDKEGKALEMKDILWVLTVPAIWDDAAKEFMKEAALMAGIPENHLLIALEPEAASLLCRHLPVEKFSVGGNVNFSSAEVGTTYMVVDLGGGTVDITVHEKIAGNKIKEVHKASGGAWGGTAIDNEFWQLFISIAGGPVMARFKVSQKYDYLDLYKEFECAKRTFQKGTESKLIVRFPATLNDICKEKQKQIFSELLKETAHASNITFIGDKMCLHPALVEKLFKKVTDQIVRHIQTILQKTEAGKKVSLMLLVGGFAESSYVRTVMKEAFEKKDLKVVIPKEPGLSVLNGAVIFGRQPDVITSRVLRFTYGVRVTPEFIPGEHPEEKKIPGTTDRCADVFSPFIREGTTVTIGQKVSAAYTTTVPNQKYMPINVYISEGSIPKFVTDQKCRLLGKLTVQVANPSAEERILTANFTFGLTTLKVDAMELKSNKMCTHSFKLLE